MPTEHHTARFQEDIEDPDNIAAVETEKTKYYVVIRSFGDFTQADAFKKKLLTEKYNADIFYYQNDKKYHVFLLETPKQHDANEEARNLKKFTKFKDAHVLTVTVKEKK